MNGPFGGIVMPETRWRVAIALVGCVLAPVRAGAAEPDPVGIVMTAIGEITPDLPARTEIPVNTAIKLGSGAELTFLHYPPKCELVTVAGGTLTVSRTAFTTDGDVKLQQSRPCPRVFALQGTGGGWIARDLLRLTINPEIIFAGSRAGQITEAAVYEEDPPDRLLFRFELLDRRATQPASAPPLTPNRRYVLRLTMSDEPQPIEHPFVIVAPGAGWSLSVLHLD